MKVYEIVFSPTGGTDTVATVVAKAMSDSVEDIDLSEQDFSGCEIPADSLAVIAMPSFGGRAPKIAIDRLKQIAGNGAKAVVIAVYGNREQEDTLIEIADTAASCGFQVIAGITAVAAHSIAPQYGAGRPDKQDIAQLRGFAEQILAKLPNAILPELPGNRPYRKAGKGLVPKGNTLCVNCGLCVANCPVGAIPKSNPQDTYEYKCIGCMRCAANCPAGARKVNRVMVKIVELALKKACSQRKENQLYLGET